MHARSKVDKERADKTVADLKRAVQFLEEDLANGSDGRR